MGREYTRIRAKRVTSETSYERSEYKSAGGAGGAVSPPRKFFEFRTPESESERNLTNYFIIFLLLFLLRIFLENIFYDYRSNLFQIFEDNNETINNICKSNAQKVNN